MTLVKDTSNCFCASCDCSNFFVSFITLNYFCLGIGAGLESMTANPMAWEGSVNPKVFVPFILTSSALFYYYFFK